MSKTTLVTQQVQLQEWFQMMQESKGRPQQIPLYHGQNTCQQNVKIRSLDKNPVIKNLSVTLIYRLPYFEGKLIILCFIKNF